MFCPNEKVRMHHVAVPSHYGQEIILDQCESCGGIWFDAYELFKVKQDEASEIEKLDSDILRAPSDIDNPTLLCPRDQTALLQYDDPNFPSGIILTRCPKCQGFWLNRGIFTKYQEVRQNLKRPKAKTLEDQRLREDVKRLLESHRDNSGADVLGKVAAFLSPSDKHAFSSSDSSWGIAEDKNPLDTVLNVLMVLLRLFVFKF
jgi:Zn-finger nucleic acid-binding protein